MPRTKYKAAKCEYRGETYDSRAEAAYARHLDDQVERGEILWYLRQPKFALGCPENVYRSDFLLVARQYTAAVDVKGFDTPKFRRDKKLWARYGPCPLQVVRLKLRYPKLAPGGEPTLPEIRGVDFDLIHGGRDRRVYGPLSPDWLRTQEIPR